MDPILRQQGGQNREDTDHDTPRNEPIGMRLFDSSRVLVTGGQFTLASRDHAANIVHNHYYGHGSGVEHTPQTQPSSIHPSHSNENQESPVELPPVPIQFQGVAESRRGRTNRIYERHMLCKERGYPLWIPEISMGLSPEKRRLGVSIGDVGLVTSAGAFSFLFNILLPVDHPLQPETMPSGFTPVKPLNPGGVMTVVDLSVNSCLTSVSVRRVTAEQGGTSSSIPDQVFELSESEGAVLALPDGAISSDMENLLPWKRYMADHIASWYLYVIGQLGREVKNGDIRLVVGVDKTTSWGMAVAEQNRQSLNSQPSRLRFGPSPDANSPVRHKWDCTGLVETRAGPRVDFWEQLLSDRGSTLHNQCVFIRTINATLREEIWSHINAEVDIITLADDSQDQHSRSTDSADTRGKSAEKRQGATNSSPIAAWTGSKSYANDWVDDPHKLQRQYADDHPGDTLNEALLAMPTKLFSNARMAITSDYDWCQQLRSGMGISCLNEAFWKSLIDSEQSAECTEEGIIHIKKLPKVRGSGLLQSLEPVAQNDTKQLPTLENAYINSIDQAHQIFLAVVKGRFPLVRNPLNAEEMRNIKSGDIYVWEERHISTTNELVLPLTCIEAVYTEPDPLIRHERLAKQSCSVYTTLLPPGARRLLHMVAYFNPSKIQRRNIASIPRILGDTAIEDGWFETITDYKQQAELLEQLAEQQTLPASSGGTGAISPFGAVYGMGVDVDEPESFGGVTKATALNNASGGESPTTPNQNVWRLKSLHHPFPLASSAGAGGG
ncbi:hypothetical protein CVT24_003444 [Panaeolus cyanescens]|uniref:Uncharacterized protein n=1 Tax=Panaeolus cyanescens TaxID=181874 RepID=A0A409Y6S1_9AGAR|nr:hypothetical protein CVT24_003444 [Panaeolus cyanescens]